MKQEIIKDKEELIKVIKSLARELDDRAEDIANDWDKRVRKIDIHASIELDCINEWEITKYYPVIPKIKPDPNWRTIPIQAYHSIPKDYRNIRGVE